MQTIKRLMVLTVTVFVTAGLLYSQLCTIRCMVYECPPPAPSRITQQSEPSDHCRHSSGPEPGDPAPQKEDDSNTCIKHVEVTALLPPGPDSSAALYDQLQATAVEPFFTSSILRGALAAESAGSHPDRSPPKPTFSVLRI
jgi:hypothetical protein